MGSLKAIEAIPKKQKNNLLCSSYDRSAAEALAPFYLIVGKLVPFSSGWGLGSLATSDWHRYLPDAYGDDTIFSHWVVGGREKFFKQKRWLLKNNWSHIVCNDWHHKWHVDAIQCIEPCWNLQHICKFLNDPHKQLCQALITCVPLMTARLLKLSHLFTWLWGNSCHSAPPLQESGTMMSHQDFTSTSNSLDPRRSNNLQHPLDGSSAMLLFEGTLANHIIKPLSASSCSTHSRILPAMPPDAFAEIKESLTALLSMKHTTCLATRWCPQDLNAIATARNSHSWMMVFLPLGFKRRSWSPSTLNPKWATQHPLGSTSTPPNPADGISSSTS